MAARDVLAGEAAEGRPLEVLASEDEVGRRAEDKDQPLDVLAGEEAKGRPPEVLAGQDEVRRRLEDEIRCPCRRGGGGPAVSCFNGYYLKITYRFPFFNDEGEITRHKQSSTMRFPSALRCGMRGMFSHPNAAPR